MGYPGTNTNTKEDPIPIITVEVTDAEMTALGVIYTGNSDKKPYVVCNVQDVNNKVYFMWSGTAWVNMQVQGGGGGNTDRIVIIDFGLNGIYGSNNTTFLSIPIQVMIAKILSVGVYTKVECKINVSYATGGASTGEVELFDYTDGVAIVPTNLVLTNGTWVNKTSPAYVDISAYEGKALRLRSRRVGGVGADQCLIEGAQLILKFS